MRNLLITITFTMLLTALPMFAQEKNNAPSKKTDSDAQKTTAKPNAEDLYSRWEKLKKDTPAEAAEIAAKYLENFPDDKSENAQTLKKWLDEYKKTENIESPAKTDGKVKSSDESKSTVKAMTDKKDNAAGIWKIVVTTQQGDLQFTLTLKQDGKNLSGAVQSFYGNGTVKSGTIDGDIITLDLQAKPLEVKLNGTIDEDKMKGTVTANIPNIPELKFVGTRSKETVIQK